MDHSVHVVLLILIGTSMLIGICLFSDSSTTPTRQELGLFKDAAASVYYNAYAMISTPCIFLLISAQWTEDELAGDEGIPFNFFYVSILPYTVDCVNIASRIRACLITQLLFRFTIEISGCTNT